MDGILLIDKPIGWTSFDVVNKIRTIIERAELTPRTKKDILSVIVAHLTRWQPVC